VQWWFSRGGGVDERRDGGWKEFSTELVRHALQTWNLLLGSAAFAALLLQSWVGTERLGIFGSPLLPGLAYLVIAFFYASFRLYRDTVRAYESRIDRIFASRPQLLAGFNVHGQVAQVFEATITPVPPLPERTHYETQQRDRLAAQYDRGRAAFLERKSPFSQYGPMRETLYSRDYYAEQMDEFVERWGRYLEELRHYLLGRSATVRITPIIANTGPVTAHQVGLEISLPAGIRLADANEVEALSDEHGDWIPEKPRDPNATSGSYLSTIAGIGEPVERYSLPYTPEPQTADDARGPHVISQGSIDRVRYDIAYLTARRTEDDLPSFYVVIDGPAEHQLHNLEVALYADELDQPIRSNLVLRINSVDAAADESRLDRS
jgi:hypothetical protein